MGYHQIPVAKKDTELTSFMINGKQYEYLRMPFGLTNAPYTFQKVISFLFRDYDFIFAYLDDIFIVSPSNEEHLNHLKIFF